MWLHDESFILVSIQIRTNKNNLETRRRKNGGIETKRLTDYNYLFVIIILYYLWNVFSVRFHIQIVARLNARPAHQLATVHGNQQRRQFISYVFWTLKEWKKRIGWCACVHISRRLNITFNTLIIASGTANDVAKQEREEDVAQRRLLFLLSNGTKKNPVIPSPNYVN